MFTFNIIVVRVITSFGSKTILSIFPLRHIRSAEDINQKGFLGLKIRI